MILKVTALDVQVGDKILNSPVEADIIIEEIRRVTRDEENPMVPEYIAALGGWVSLAGDSEDGYYRKYYGDREEYFAHPDEEFEVERS